MNSVSLADVRVIHNFRLPWSVYRSRHQTLSPLLSLLFVLFSLRDHLLGYCSSPFIFCRVCVCVRVHSAIVVCYCCTRTRWMAAVGKTNAAERSNREIQASTDMKNKYVRCGGDEFYLFICALTPSRHRENRCFFFRSTAIIMPQNFHLFIYTAAYICPWSFVLCHRITLVNLEHEASCKF